MTKICFFTLRLAVLLCVLGCASPTFAHSGHVDWGPWSFDWTVWDDSGLALRGVKFQNEELIHKINMPVIRVKYNGDACGPFADQINWDRVVNNPDCGDAKVCRKTFSSNGSDWFQLGILVQIGEYTMYQFYSLAKDGRLHAELWSKGLECLINHTHHPYWRIDFDVNGPANDQLFVRSDNGANEGWGPGWHKYVKEQQDIKNPPGDKQRWFVRDSVTGHGAWIIPSSNDGSFDGGFAPWDIAARRYHSSEDESWQFTAFKDVGYNNSEDIQEKDDILWYIAHLHHNAAGGATIRHYAGPWIVVAR